MVPPSPPTSPYQVFREINGSTIGYCTNKEGEWVSDEEEGEFIISVVDENGGLLHENE
jgi:hypothetical protein